MVTTEPSKQANEHLLRRREHPRTAARIANARRAIERAGGVIEVARMLGYANGSYLLQMFGPSPSRLPTEKFVRRLEHVLGLPDGDLDKPVEGLLPPAAAPASPGRDQGSPTALDVSQLRRTISLVGKLIDEEHVVLSGDRFAALVALAYEESAEHAGHPSENKLRQVVQLLK